MNKAILFLALIAGVSIWLFVSGCGSKSGVYGKPLTENKSVAIAELLKKPDQFTGKSVRLEGKIIQECPAGGWFMLKDKTGVILVDLHPSEIAIPQAINHHAAAQGKVKNEYNQVSVVGEGVDLK